MQLRTKTPEEEERLREREEAERKAKALNDNNIDVFFEDAPDVVAHLRRLCKSTKIVQYGGRF